MAHDVQPNSLEAQWMPFTDNRGFKAEPRLVVEAEGNYLTDHRGSTIIDGSSGLFCCPAGHCHPKIIEAVHEQMKVNTYTSPFGMAHPSSFMLADKISKMTPDGINHVFFVNSGSEAVDTALKIVMAYHAARGDDARTRFVSRERAYHGVNIGGVSLSGMVNNRKTFPSTMPNVVMMRHTWNEADIKTKGLPQNNGVELANDLERAYETVTDKAAPGAIEFFHGYTYSGHPAACAAGNAMQDIISEEGLVQRAADMAPYFEDACFTMKDHPLVKDIRVIGMMAGIELHPGATPGARGVQMQKEMFFNGLHVKFTGDNGILAPMFIAEKAHIDEIIEKFSSSLDAHAA